MNKDDHGREEWDSPPPYELGDWPDQDDANAWSGYALRLLANEIHCVIQHLDRGERTDGEGGEAGYSDYYNIAMHLKNLQNGITETAATIFQLLLTDEERIAVTMHVMEKELGVPMRVADLGNGSFAIVPDTVVVPDSLEGMSD